MGEKDGMVVELQERENSIVKLRKSIQQLNSNFSAQFQKLSTEHKSKEEEQVQLLKKNIDDIKHSYEVRVSKLDQKNLKLVEEKNACDHEIYVLNSKIREVEFVSVQNTNKLAASLKKTQELEDTLKVVEEKLSATKLLLTQKEKELLFLGQTLDEKYEAKVDEYRRDTSSLNSKIHSLDIDMLNEKRKFETKIKELVEGQKEKVGRLNEKMNATHELKKKELENVKAELQRQAETEIVELQRKLENMKKIQQQTEKMLEDTKNKLQESIKKESFNKDLHTKEVAALNDALHSLRMEQESIRDKMNKKNEELHQLEIEFTKSKSDLETEKTAALMEKSAAIEHLKHEIEHLKQINEQDRQKHKETLKSENQKYQLLKGMLEHEKGKCTSLEKRIQEQFDKHKQKINDLHKDHEMAKKIVGEKNEDILKQLREVHKEKIEEIHAAHSKVLNDKEAAHIEQISFFEKEMQKDQSHSKALIETVTNNHKKREEELLVRLKANFEAEKLDLQKQRSEEKKQREKMEQDIIRLKSEYKTMEERVLLIQKGKYSAEKSLSIIEIEKDGMVVEPQERENSIVKLRKSIQQLNSNFSAQFQKLSTEHKSKEEEQVQLLKKNIDDIKHS